jgi:hypothetical protein
MHSGRRMASSRRRGYYNMPESFSAFCNIVSFTAAKTSRIFDVSVACVRLHLLADRFPERFEVDVLWIEI